MAETTLTRVSTKGQVVIPLELREEMGISPKDEFLIYGENDTILMKKIIKPKIEESFKDLNKRLSKKMKQNNITRKDVEKAIAEVRREKK